MTMEWNSINWKKVNYEVSTLQQRIYRNTLRKEACCHLQQLVINSWSAKLKAVRRVTQENRGKDTPGVDSVKSLSPNKRLDLCKKLKVDGKSHYMRRTYIPKGPNEKRPLGIPTIEDRAKQALVLMALEPEWEAKFQANSYGFRPGRSCHDAIEAIVNAIFKKNKYLLHAHIRKCFDSINHQSLLNKLNCDVQIKKQIESWLKTGIMENDKLFPSTKGTPQGGIISPLLANIALHGMENMLKEYVATVPVKGLERAAKMQRLTFVTYADDLVVIHPDKLVLSKCQELLNAWLEKIGLELDPDKTKIIPALSNEESKFEFDFLGFRITQRFIGKHRVKNNRLKLPFLTHTIPSPDSIREHKMDLKECIKKEQDVVSLLSRINPKIRGWAQYFRIGVSKKIFGDMDAWMYHAFLQWAKKKHPTRGGSWLVEKYFKQIDPTKWIFGISLNNETRTKIRQRFYRETAIERHVKVQGTRSPYDGDSSYWSTRMTRYTQAVLPREISVLLKRQEGKCALCKQYFFPNEGTQIDHIIPRSKGGTERYSNLQLLHIHCHQTKSRKDSSIEQSS